MNQKTLELWKQRIADKKVSGLNVIVWCEKNNLTKNAYYYWLKRYQKAKETYTNNRAGRASDATCFD